MRRPCTVSRARGFRNIVSREMSAPCLAYRRIFCYIGVSQDPAPPVPPEKTSFMLTLSGVTHVYPNGTKALDNATLNIDKGMFGLLGPNGAGKSTLMRCIATLQPPSAGSIVFDGIDVVKEPERLRAQLGYLPQEFGVYPR